MGAGLRVHGMTIAVRGASASGKFQAADDKHLYRCLPGCCADSERIPDCGIGSAWVFLSSCPRMQLRPTNGRTPSAASPMERSLVGPTATGRSGTVIHGGRKRNLPTSSARQKSPALDQRRAVAALDLSSTPGWGGRSSEDTARNYAWSWPRTLNSAFLPRPGRFPLRDHRCKRYRMAYSGNFAPCRDLCPAAMQQPGFGTRKVAKPRPFSRDGVRRTVILTYTTPSISG